MNKSALNGPVLLRHTESDGPVKQATLTIQLFALNPDKIPTLVL